MKYVFDSDTLIDLFRHYYLERFPSLWEKFDAMVSDGRIVSVREVYNEIEGHGDRLSEWASSNKDFFCIPAKDELDFVREIFEVNHFQTLIQKKQQLSGKPVADPFVIAKAKADGCMVVTQEKFKENVAKIPNVGEHFNIPYKNRETFMKEEDWTY